MNRRQVLTSAVVLASVPLTGGIEAAEQPDARLIWLNEEWSRIEARANVAETDEEINVLCDQLTEIEEEIFGTPAQSVRGIEAKLCRVRHFADVDGGFNGSHRGFASVDRDIVRIAEQGG